MVYGKGLLLLGAFSMIMGSGARENLPLLMKSGADPAPIHSSATQVKLDKLDPALNQIVPSDARLEQVANGFNWTEGPVWMPSGYLMFAEIISNSIRKVTPDGHVSIFMQPSGYKGAAPYFGLEPGSNGMTLDRQGRLTVAGHAQRNVWRLESLDPHGPRTILADSYQGKKLNSPNDLVYKSDGSLYFTDPPYGIRAKGDQYPGKELKINGVYRIPAAATQPAGSEPRRSQLQLLVSDLNRPNGIAFSPDERFLYVDSTEPQKIWMRYPVKADGTLGKGVVFCDATSDQRPGAPDGLKVDTKGNIYSAGPGGIWIFSPAGKHLGTILLPNRAGNVAWGGSDGRTLYIAMSDKILKIRLSIPGILPGRRGHIGG